jgi:transposase
MGKKERRSFSEEFKQDAVRRAEAGEQTFSHIARDLGIHSSLLQTWRRKYGTARTVASVTKPASSLEDENRRLRRENAALREDREILKKTSAFFAKELR